MKSKIEVEYRGGILCSRLEAYMKLFCILPLGLTLATTVAVGQVNLGSAKATALTITPSSSGNCPIGLEVNHGWLYAQKRAGLGLGPKDPMPLADAVQRINLTMTNPSSREIVKVQLTVHGFSDKGRLFTLGSAVPDLTRKITFERDIQGNGHATHDLALKDFTAVSSVDLDSLTYADGSTWNATIGGFCSVSPNSLMRVSAVR